MTPEFRASIQRAMQHNEKQGITCRHLTTQERAMNELKAREEHAEKVRLSKKTKRKGKWRGIRQGAKPFAMRLDDVKRVQKIAAERGIRILDACDIVGISFANYRGVKAAHQKGLTKRP